MTAWLALRPRTAWTSIRCVWIAILILATLRSPFLPVRRLPVALAGDLDCGGRLAAPACALAGHRVVALLAVGFGQGACRRRSTPSDVRPHRRRARAGRTAIRCSHGAAPEAVPTTAARAGSRRSRAGLTRPCPAPCCVRFLVVVLAAAAACAGVVGFTASAGVRDDMAGRDGRRDPRRGGDRRGAGPAARVRRARRDARRPIARDAVRGRQPRRRRPAGLADALHHRRQPRDLDASPLAPMPSMHSCASAYWVAGSAVDRTPDIYDEVALFAAAGRQDGDANGAQAGAAEHRQLRVSADVPARAAASSASSRPTSGASAGSGSRSTSGSSSSWRSSWRGASTSGWARTRSG